MKHHPQVERAVDDFALVVGEYEATVISWALVRDNPASPVPVVNEALGRMRKAKDKVYDHVRQWALRAYSAERAVLLWSERNSRRKPADAIQAILDTANTDP